jgi:hypothetical protein
MPGPATAAFPDGYLAIRLENGTPLVRIHRQVHGPVWFGPALGAPPGSRFDAPAGEYRTLYAALSVEGAFAEVVLRRANRVLTRPFVAQYRWTDLRCGRDLTLVKLFGEGLLYHGVTGDIGAGDDYAASRALALSLFEAFPDIDGVAYRSRHNNDELCVALFDRVVPGDLEAVGGALLLDDAAEIDRLVRLYGAAWDRSDPVPPLSQAG